MSAQPDDRGPVPVPQAGTGRTHRPDGRTRRAQRTRDAVIEALLALQEEGDLAPTALRVAERAGVALRTVYGHFADMEALWLEAGRRELDKISALADLPDPSLPLPDRVARYCASRARVLEALLPVMRATRLRLPTSAQLRRNWALYVQVGDRETRAWFRPELDRMSDTDGGALLDALYLVSATGAWDALRGDRGLAPADAQSVMESSVGHLLVPRPLSRVPAQALLHAHPHAPDSEGPR